MHMWIKRMIALLLVICIAGVIAGCSAGMYEMYEDYIEGRRELREINMEYRSGYMRGNTKPDRIGCGMG